MGEARSGKRLSLPVSKNPTVRYQKIALSTYKLEGDIEEKIKSCAYPTLRVLQELQARNGEEPKDPTLTLVPPFPPKRQKSDLFNPENYTELDKYVNGILPQPKETWITFSDRLFSQCQSNLDKVRAAFYFLGTVKVELLSKNDVTNNGLKNGPFEYIRQLRSGFATEVFEVLLVCGDVPYKKIFGFKKGDAYRPGTVCPRGGHWYACYVDGEWRFVDIAWGSSFTNSEERQNPTYSCDESYFLPDPTTFILTHCPEDEDADWQLLSRKVTVAEFNQMLFVEPKVLELFDIQIVSHPKNVIVMDETQLHIEIRIKETNSYKYSIETLDADEEWKPSNPTDSIKTTIKKSDEEIVLLLTPSKDGVYFIDIVVENPEAQLRANYTSYMFRCVGVTLRAQRRSALHEGLKTHPWDTEVIENAMKGVKLLKVLEESDNKMLNYAEKVQTLLAHRKELLDNIRNIQTRHTSTRCKCISTEDLIATIEKETIDSDMKQEVEKSLSEAKQILATRRLLNTKSQLLAELRNYPQPERSVHETVQAVLLLLEHYEQKTRRWKRCQPLIKDLQKKLNAIEWESLHPGIVARTQKILDGIDRREMINYASEAVVDLYDWAVHLAWCREQRHSKTDFVAAMVEEQAQLFQVSETEQHIIRQEDKHTITRRDSLIPADVSLQLVEGRRYSSILSGRKDSLKSNGARRDSTTPTYSKNSETSSGSKTMPKIGKTSRLTTVPEKEKEATGELENPLSPINEKLPPIQASN